jgi:hypothetical protein
LGSSIRTTISGTAGPNASATTSVRERPESLVESVLLLPVTLTEGKAGGE